MKRFQGFLWYAPHRCTWFFSQIIAVRYSHSTPSSSRTDGHSSSGELTSLSPRSGEGKRRGKIVQWNSFERCGTIRDELTGQELKIASTRSFETVLPSHLRGGLEGAEVLYAVADSAAAADRVLIRRHTDRLTMKSYQQKPPIDFLSLSARSEVMGGGGSPQPREGAVSSVPDDSSISTLSSLFAHHIEVDMSTLAPNQLARCDGPLAVGYSDGAGGEVAIAPPKHLKDMRASTIFDTSTNEWLRLRKALGSAEAADAYIQERDKRRREGGERDGLKRVVVASAQRGVVLAWSALHRTGVVKQGVASEELRERLRKGEDEPFEPDAEDVAFIRSVHCFESALPSSRELRGRIVVFDKVQYSSQPRKYFAEQIKVQDDTDFKPSIEDLEAQLPRVHIGSFPLGSNVNVTFAAANSKKEGGTKDCVDEHSAPAAPLYGVITRWSGGQGIIESSSGKSFRILSAAHFNQLVDLSSRTLRGAVVSFQCDPTEPGSAKAIDILCISSDRIEEVKPTVEATRPHSQTSTLEQPSVGAGSQQVKEVYISAPSDGEWVYGTLVSWSAAEGQGIIQGDAADSARYVLRDPTTNVIGTTAAGHSNSPARLLTAGRRLKFTAYGSTGRLACNVVVLDDVASEGEVESSRLTLATEEDTEKHEEKKLSLDSSEEAIVSPTCTSYWLQRMERAGYNVQEVSDMQNKALTPPTDDEDDKFLDSEDLFKKDHWWNDPRKNKKFPNSQVTAGHLALMGPASMMNMAAKASDPKRLDKMVKKYQARLTEEQKAYAWEKAKEMAPKYETCIRRAKAKKEEPTFHFF
eukprot:gene2026-1216_t